MKQKGDLWIGTSGWSYQHWLDIFYPRSLPSAERLPFYAQRFRTVEINYSFYRLPERKTFENWRINSPDGFLYAVKASRYLTHRKRLQEPEEPLERLLNRATGLGEKLGPILFQLPPNWPVDMDRLSHFLAALLVHPGHRYVFEFRNKSWYTPETFEQLERNQVALCIPVHPDWPRELRLTTGWTYLRMHRGECGAGYTEQELKEWAGHIDEFLANGNDVYVYFNNDPDGHALEDAKRLGQLLES